MLDAIQCPSNQSGTGAHPIWTLPLPSSKPSLWAHNLDSSGHNILLSFFYQTNVSTFGWKALADTKMELSERIVRTLPIIDWWRIWGIAPLGERLYVDSLPDYAHYPLYSEHLHCIIWRAFIIRGLLSRQQKESFSFQGWLEAANSSIGGTFPTSNANSSTASTIIYFFVIWDLTYRWSN